jgi:uracil permease
MSEKDCVLDINEKPKNIFSWFLLSTQHVFAMFGATILVPIIVGLNPLTALFTAGLGTLLFILITKAKVPIFLGSSFAFIPPLIAISAAFGWEYAMGGAFISGLFYCLISFIIYKCGKEWFNRMFPPIVIGAVIITIGLNLAPVAVGMAMNNPDGIYSLVYFSIAMFSLASTIIISVFTKGFFKVIPILGGIILGYLFTLIMGFIFPIYNIIDFSIISSAPWFNFPSLIIPKFAITPILIFVIVSLATILEHIGDVHAVSSITGRNLYENPGVTKTLIGDGLATSLASLFGGPPNTSYGENVGVLSLTKVFSVWVTGGAAVIAILLSFIGKFGAVIQTIPTPVLGGVCMLLFCLIAASGLKMLVKAGIDYSDNKNLCITACILAPGIGGLAFNAGQFSLSGVALGAILGIIANLIISRK